MGYTIKWAVFLSSRELLTTFDRSEINFLRQQGITVRDRTTRSSQLVVIPTKAPLLDFVQCIAEDINTGATIMGERVDVIIYGKSMVS